MRRVGIGVRIALLQSAVIAVVVIAGYSGFAALWGNRLEDEYGQRVLAVARSVAAEPKVRAAVAGCGRGAARCQARDGVAELAEMVRMRTGSLFVVITDQDGVRLSHPDPRQIGQRVSTDPSAALAGAEVVTEETGTLGDSARAKVPVLGPDGRVEGIVSVGIGRTSIETRLVDDLGWAAVYGAGALALGIAGSLLLSRYLRRRFLGLEPEQVAEMVREQEAVLHGIDEGVLAVDAQGRVVVANDEARRLLGLAADPVGAPAAGLPLPPRARELLCSPDPGPVAEICQDRSLLMGASPVRRDGQDLGVVLVVRDRSAVVALTCELDAVRSLSDALRAQRHEFANRLHAVGALIAAGHVVEAGEYLTRVLGGGPLGLLLEGLDMVADPLLQSFLGAKAARARELGVELVLGPGTWSDARLRDAVEITTVLGNLVDNAVDAASRGTHRPARVEVEIVEEGDTVHLTVTDSGDGIQVHDAFASGVSRHDPDEGRGLGLAIARQTARARGGDVWVAGRGGPGTGATFVARIPAALVVSPKEPA